MFAHGYCGKDDRVSKPFNHFVAYEWRHLEIQRHKRIFSNITLLAPESVRVPTKPQDTHHYDHIKQQPRRPAPPTHHPPIHIPNVYKMHFTQKRPPPPSRAASTTTACEVPICSFYNRTFDSFLYDQRSQDEAHSSTGLDDITEAAFDEDWDDHPDDPKRRQKTNPSTLTTRSVPNFKVRISDEWGRRINSIQSPNSDFFDDDYNAVAFSSLQNYEKTEAFGLSVAEAGVPKCCSKCSHSCNNNSSTRLPLQFSSSFD